MRAPEALHAILDFAVDLRRIARTGSLPGYRIAIERSSRGAEVLHVCAAPRERMIGQWRISPRKSESGISCERARAFGRTRHRDFGRTTVVFSGARMPASR